MKKQLLCPNDNTPLLISSKNSIEIEYCERCGGVWLDHGELEKLISLSEQQKPNFGPPNISPPSQQQNYSHDHQQNHHKKKEKGGWLGDIFDF